MESHSSTFNVPFLSRSQSHLYRNPRRFHMSNFILLALRQFYSIAIFPLKSFSSFVLSRSSSSSFLLFSCPTSFSAHLYLHLSLSFLPLLLSYILFSINNNSRSLPPSLVCVGHAVSITRVFTIPRRSRAIFLSPITSFLPFSSSTSHSPMVLSLSCPISSHRTNRTQSIRPPPRFVSLPRTSIPQPTLLILAHQPHNAPLSLLHIYCLSLFYSSISLLGF